MSSSIDSDQPWVFIVRTHKGSTADEVHLQSIYLGDELSFTEQSSCYSRLQLYSWLPCYRSHDLFILIHKMYFKMTIVLKTHSLMFDIYNS